MLLQPTLEEVLSLNFAQWEINILPTSQIDFFNALSTLKYVGNNYYEIHLTILLV